jgi:lipopolysaccharide assembly outer membrane protein LptD (OstA)
LTHLEDNVSEWVNTSGGNSVVRGGSWKTNPGISDRMECDPNYMDGTVGFRIVQSYISPEQEKEAKSMIQSRKLNSESVNQEISKGKTDKILTNKGYTRSDTIPNLIIGPTDAEFASDTTGKKVIVEHADSFGSKDGKDVQFFVGDVVVKYGDIEIKADSIVLNKRTHELFATGKKDKSGKIINQCIVRQGTSEFKSDELTYNFDTHNGYYKNVIGKTTLK